MKIRKFKYFGLICLFVFLTYCSTKKNTFISRNYHAVTTDFNILYNGNIALERGIRSLKMRYKDNFWEILPVERMHVKEKIIIYADTVESKDFVKAEEKATKAIQKHSMNISGYEKNPAIDEAYFLLGKSRYYQQRFIPALEAFNYILYKYSYLDKIYEAKIWKEKINIRMNYDELAIKNIKKLLIDLDSNDQIVADANAILTQAYLNIEQKDSAISAIKVAKDYTRSNEEKARYKFILGQLYEEIKKKDSAYAAYQSVIDMNRKSPKQYVIHAYAKQAKYFDFRNGDRDAFVKKYTILLNDRENRAYLDILNHQMGLFYDRIENDSLAVFFYNKSLRSLSEDDYLIASNYRNLAMINFNRANYLFAGHYYDSTMVKMNPNTREYRDIKKKRESLVDVINYENIVKVDDSILNILALSEKGRVDFFEKYLIKINQEKERIAKNPVSNLKNSFSSSLGKSLPSKFYFYNPATVVYGKSEFTKKWGERQLKNNWRKSEIQTVFEIEMENEDAVKEDSISEVKDKKEDIKHRIQYYLDRLPKETAKIDSITQERNFAYYQLGLVYENNFKKYNLAASKLEKLLEYNPEEKLILPTIYNLYKIYEVIDKNKAEKVKQDILDKYPKSRYAQILSNPNTDIKKSMNDPEVLYTKLYKKVENEEYKLALEQIDSLLVMFSGYDIVSKYELLKANIIAKLKGVGEYKKALSQIVLDYPNSEEGKKAKNIIENDIVKLEKLEFDRRSFNNWKIVLKVSTNDEEKIEHIEKIINEFIVNKKYQDIKLSLDNYTIDEKFIVIHSFFREFEAHDFIYSLLKEDKKHKIIDPFYVISNDNYRIVQIKKNFTQYLKMNKNV